MTVIEIEILKKLSKTNPLLLEELKDSKNSKEEFEDSITKMIKESLVVEKNGKFFLGHEGLKKLNFIEGDKILEVDYPTPVVLMIPVKGNKALLVKRKKEPFKNYYLWPAGKVKFGESVIEVLNRELFEETGLKGKPEFIGTVSSLTYLDNKLSYHVYMFVFKIHDPIGEFKIESDEGENIWTDLDEIKNLPLAPQDEIILEKMTKRNWFIEEKSFLESGKLKNRTIEYHS